MNSICEPEFLIREVAWDVGEKTALHSFKPPLHSTLLTESF